MDWLIVLLLASIAAVFVSWLNQQLAPAVYRHNDVWFQADLKRTLSNMVSTQSDHYRTNVHPIFSLTSHSAVAVLRRFWSGTDVESAMRVAALIAAAWAAGIYALGRLLGASRIEAAVFALVGITSASFVYWFSVPETYAWGSLTILGVLLVAARTSEAPPRDGMLVAASAASLSMTVTNWMAGLFLAFFTRSRKSAVRISLMALALVAVLAIVQKVLFPTSNLFFLGSTEEADYVGLGHSGGAWRELPVLFLASMTMPAQRTLAPAKPPDWMLLSIQDSSPGSASPYGPLALVLWVALLCGGAYGLVAAYFEGRHRTYARVLGATLLGQVGLHLVYGEETFLYVAHQAPLLLGIALFALRLRARPMVVAGAALLSALDLTNNLRAFSASETHVATSLTEREKVMRAMSERPREVWPRGRGHVVLGSPGGALETKAYEEPGGSFSPARGSFGISVFVADASGKVVAASDTVPLAVVTQRFGAMSNGVPRLKSSTPYFDVEWSRVGDDWILQLRCKGPDRRRCWIVVRSVGPAGGPIVTAKWEGSVLHVNDAWRLELDRAPLASFVADESRGGVRLTGEGNAEGRDASGWLYAAAEAPADGVLEVRVSSTKPPPEPSRLRVREDRLLAPHVPDELFSASVVAQQLHLLMGLTSDETRPGEPSNYTFEWLRDAAYIVVALSRAGQTELAAQLMQKLAKADFFGGFGAEADAPGLALWALGEVSEALGDGALDGTLWPDVERKAGYIERCLATEQGVRAEPSGTNWAEAAGFRVCEPPRLGLIAGRMDNHYPFLFVNATAYLGLENAARLARRTGHDDHAERWTSTAEGLAAAWKRLFLQAPSDRKMDAWKLLRTSFPDLAREKQHAIRRTRDLFSCWRHAVDDDRTFIAGAWPSWIVLTDAALRAAYADALLRRGSAASDSAGRLKDRSIWTYFTLAEAHQWLLLGRPERAMPTLSWFLEHSAAPGLYTWWEGTGEENGAKLWEGTRGFVAPDGVSPHYWTAAEMLLLELDMLAYVDESSATRPVVVGAGVPREWLEQGIESGTVHTARGPVSWSFHDGTLEVATVDDAVPIEVAKVFSGARVLRRAAASPDL